MMTNAERTMATAWHRAVVFPCVAKSTQQPALKRDERLVYMPEKTKSLAHPPQSCFGTSGILGCSWEGRGTSDK